MTILVAEYRELLERFVRHEIDIDSFQRSYFDKFKNDPREMDETVFRILDTLFGDIDSFTTDASLLQKDPAFYLDEAGLRKRVVQATEQLSGRN